MGSVERSLHIVLKAHKDGGIAVLEDRNWKDVHPTPRGAQVLQQCITLCETKLFLMSVEVRLLTAHVTSQCCVGEVWIAPPPKLVALILSLKSPRVLLLYLFLTAARHYLLLLPCPSSPLSLLLSFLLLFCLLFSTGDWIQVFMHARHILDH